MLSDCQYDILKTVGQEPFIQIGDLSKRLFPIDSYRFKLAVCDLVKRGLLIITPTQDYESYENSLEVTSKCPPKYDEVFHLVLSEYGHSINDEHKGIQRQLFWTSIVAALSLACSAGTLLVEILQR